MSSSTTQNGHAIHRVLANWATTRKPSYLISSAVAAALAAAAAWYGDREIAAWLSFDELPGDVRRIIHLSEIFGHGYGVALMLLATWILAPQVRRSFPRLMAIAIIPGVAAQLIKLFVIRYRPAAFVTEPRDTAVDLTLRLAEPLSNVDYLTQSFPSGHTASAFGAALGLAWLFPRGRFFFLLLACMAGVQRIADNAHWPSDVLAGAAIASFCAFLILPRPVQSDPA